MSHMLSTSNYLAICSAMPALLVDGGNLTRYSDALTFNIFKLVVKPFLRARQGLKLGTTFSFSFFFCFILGTIMAVLFAYNSTKLHNLEIEIYFQQW